MDSKPKRQQWSAADVEFLTANYATATEAELVARLQRPWSHIKNKVAKAGLQLNRTRVVWDEQTVLTDYQAGIPLASICARFNCSTPTLYALLDRHGVSRKNKSLEDSPEFRSDYQTLNMPALEAKYGVSRPTLRAKATALGLVRPEWLKHKQPKLSKEQQDQACVSFLAGESREAVGETLGVSAATIFNLTKARSLERPASCGSQAQIDLRVWLASVTGKVFVADRTLLQGKEVDLYCPELALGIEYCGLYWHHEDAGPSRKDPNCHQWKYLRCKEQGVRLITIFEDEWKNRQSQVKGFLRSVLKANARRFNARDCSVAVLPKAEAEAFIEQEHIQGANRRGIIYAGLSLDGELLGCMSFGPHPRESGLLVLDRLCFKSGCSVVGGASKLFKFLLLETEPEKIISWSDNRWSDGAVYPLLGFRKEEALSPDYSYVDFGSGARLSKQSQKKSATGCPPTMTELAFARSRDLHRIWDCGKVRWAWTPNGR